MDQTKTLAELETPSLQKWKQAPTVRDLKQDLEEAKTTHDSQVTKINGWLDNLLVRGSAKANAPKGNSQIVPKLIRKQAEWRYAALSEPFLSTEDLFDVQPVTWEDKQSAIQNQIILSRQFNTQIDKTKFIDDYVRAAVDEGTAIVRVGWEFQEEEYEEEVPIVEFVVNEEIGPIHEQIAQLKAESPSQYMTDVPEELKQAHEMTMEEGVPIEPQILGYEMQTKTRTIVNRPTLEVCDYRNVIIDPTCMGDIEKASFVIYSFESSKAELEKDGKYKNLDHILVDNNSILGEPDHSGSDGSNFNFKDEPRKRIVVYEYWGYWDIHGTGQVVPIVAAWVGETMIRLEENPFPDQKIPFVTVQYLPVRRKVYGEPDGELLEDNQKIVGAVTRGMIDLLAKSANAQTGIRKDLLDATNKRRFDQGRDYEFNPVGDPTAGIYIHKFAEIPRSAQYMLDLQNMEAESLTGVKAFSQGISAASLGNVATSVRGALDAASKRELGILRRLANGIIQIGRKIISMNSEFLSEEEVIRITNEEFALIKREDLSGNFDLKLKITTAEEDDRKAQELAFMLQTTGNTMDPAMTNMILADIARLRKMPDLAKRIETYEPEPDPFMEQMKQIEMETAIANLELTQAKTQSLLAGSQLDGAKVGTEIAKASNIQSDTDQKNLDFVEQESGVRHARDLEKTGEQARSQGNLKMLDHELKQEEKSNDLLRDYLYNHTKRM